MAAEQLKFSILVDAPGAEAKIRGVAEGMDRLSASATRAQRATGGARLSALGADAAKAHPGLSALGFDTAALHARLDALQTKIPGTVAGTGALAAGFRLLTPAIIGTIAALAGAHVVLSSFTDTVQQGLQLGDLARELDVPVEGLSALARQADLTGIELTDLIAPIQGVQKALTEAAGDPLGRAAKNLEAFGISTKDVTRLLGEDGVTQLKAFVSQMQKYESGAAKATTASKVLTESGLRAVNRVLAENVSAFSETTDAAGRWTTEQVQAAEEVRRTFRELGQAWEDTKHSLFVESGLLQSLDALFERIQSIVTLLKQDFGKAFVAGLQDIADIASGQPGQRTERLLRDITTARENARALAAATGGGFTIGGGGPPLLPPTLKALTPPPGDRQDRRAEQIETRLRKLRTELEALRDPAAAIEAEIAGAVEQLRALGASDAQVRQLRASLEEIAALKLGKDLEDQLRKVGQALLELQDPALAVRASIDEMLRPFEERFAALERAGADVAALRGELDALRASADKVQIGQSLGQVAHEIENAGSSLRDQFGDQALAQLADRLQEVGGEGASAFASIRTSLASLRGPQAEINERFDEIARTLQNIEGGTSFLPLVEQVRQYSLAAKEGERTSKAFFDVFASLERGAGDVFEALILGTRDVADAFEGLKLSIIRSFTEAFIEGLKKKVGFEGAFKVNIVQFGSNIVSLLGGILGGGGTGGQGFLGTLFNGVFGGSGFGGGTQTAGSSFFGGGTSVNGGGRFGGVVGGGSSTAGRGGGFSGFGGNVPGTGILGGLFGGASGAGFTAGQRVAEFGFGAVANEFGVLHALQGTISNIASSLSSVIAIVGAVYSLAQTVKGQAETFKNFKKITFGDPQANRNFQAGSTVSLVAGAVSGAAAGAAIGTIVPGIGNVVGAVVGAAIGAAISKAVSDSIANSVGKSVSNAIKHGFSQEQLDQEVKDRLSDNIILNIASGFSNTVLSQLVGGLVSPDIERIFDKILIKALGKLAPSVSFERGLGGARGLGATAAATRELQPLAGDARVLSRILGGLIGAGRDNVERITRFTNIIVNSLAASGQSFEEAQGIIFKIVRALGNNRLSDALRVIQGIFPQKDRDTGGVAGSGAVGGRFRAEDLLIRAFKATLPQLDIAGIVETFIEGQFTTSQRALRRSRKAVGQALPSLFEGETAGEGIAKFGQQLQNTIRDAFIKGFSQALLKTPIGDFLAGMLRTLNKELKRLVKQGFTEENLDRFTGKLNEQAGFLEKLFADPGLTAFLTRMIEIEKKLEQSIAAALIKADAAAGNLDAARQAIESRLAPFVENLRGFQQLGKDIKGRTAFAIAGGGFQGDRDRIDALRENRIAARGRLLGASGSPLIFTLPDLVKSEAFQKNLPRALELLNEFADARLTELEAEIDLARQMKSFFEQAAKAFRNLRDEIAVIRGGPRGQRDILDRLRAEAQGLLPKALEGDQDAIARLQEIFPQILNLAQQLFAPGSAAFQDILNFLDDSSAALGVIFDKKIDEAALAIDKTTAELNLFRTTMGPVIDFFTKLSKDALQNEFNAIVKELGTEGAIYGILADIARGLGLTITDRTRTDDPPPPPPSPDRDDPRPPPPNPDDPFGRFDNPLPPPPGGLPTPPGSDAPPGTIDELNRVALRTVKQQAQAGGVGLLTTQTLPDLVDRAGHLSLLATQTWVPVLSRVPGLGTALLATTAFIQDAQTIGALSEKAGLAEKLLEVATSIPSRRGGGAVTGSAGLEAPLSHAAVRDLARGGLVSSARMMGGTVTAGTSLTTGHLATRQSGGATLIGMEGPSLFSPSSAGVVLSHTHPTTQSLLRAASGGATTAGTYLVGEAGPETFIPRALGGAVGPPLRMAGGEVEAKTAGAASGLLARLSGGLVSAADENADGAAAVLGLSSRVWGGTVTGGSSAPGGEDGAEAFVSRAMGGAVTPDRAVWVGDRGAETFSASEPATLTQHREISGPTSAIHAPTGIHAGVNVAVTATFAPIVNVNHPGPSNQEVGRAVTEGIRDRSMPDLIAAIRRVL